MIELRNLTKRYGNTVAVNNLSISVAKGEIYGFIGPNGAGKTTTIRIMGGVLAPTDGAIIIDGINMTDDPESVKSRVGFIPDRPFIYQKLTGMEFMKFSADLYGVDERVFAEKAQALLKEFAIYNWADELIESYSHGMKQRLIISSALLHDPAVIIVDEPMVGLDPAAIKMVKNIFRDLAKKGGTIFMSTHTLSVAEDICDRVGVIHRGSLIATGTVGDLQRAADIREGDLEEVFLILTEERSFP